MEGGRGRGREGRREGKEGDCLGRRRGKGVDGEGETTGFQQFCKETATRTARGKGGAHQTSRVQPAEVSWPLVQSTARALMAYSASRVTTCTAWAGSQMRTVPSSEADSGIPLSILTSVTGPLWPRSARMNLRSSMPQRRTAPWLQPATMRSSLLARHVTDAEDCPGSLLMRLPVTWLHSLMDDPCALITLESSTWARHTRWHTQTHA